jgi:hypothetical protein
VPRLLSVVICSNESQVFDLRQEPDKPTLDLVQFRLVFQNIANRLAVLPILNAGDNLAETFQVRLPHLLRFHTSPIRVLVSFYPTNTICSNECSARVYLVLMKRGLQV